jgi:hypothetical protein
MIVRRTSYVASFYRVVRWPALDSYSCPYSVQVFLFLFSFDVFGPCLRRCFSHPCTPRGGRCLRTGICRREKEKRYIRLLFSAVSWTFGFRKDWSVEPCPVLTLSTLVFQLCLLGCFALFEQPRAKTKKEGGKYVLQTRYAALKSNDSARTARRGHKRQTVLGNTPPAGCRQWNAVSQ